MKKSILQLLLFALIATSILGQEYSMEKLKDVELKPGENINITVQGEGNYYIKINKYGELGVTESTATNNSSPEKYTCEGYMNTVCRLRTDGSSEAIHLEIVNNSSQNSSCKFHIYRGLYYVQSSSELSTINFSGNTHNIDIAVKMTDVPNTVSAKKNRLKFSLSKRIERNSIKGGSLVSMNISATNKDGSFED